MTTFITRLDASGSGPRLAVKDLSRRCTDEVARPSMQTRKLFVETLDRDTFRLRSRVCGIIHLWAWEPRASVADGWLLVVFSVGIGAGAYGASHYPVQTPQGRLPLPSDYLTRMLSVS